MLEEGFQFNENLLIEDHADSRRNLRRLIEQRGHEVVACASAEEAEVEHRKRRALPFSDPRLDAAGKSGVDLCRSWRAGRTATRCISCS